MFIQHSNTDLENSYRKESLHMTNKPEIIILDVRGEVCPGPLLKVMEAMRGALTGQDIEMLTDFMPAVLVVTNAALKEGWDINIRHLNPTEWKVVLAQVSSDAPSN
jgi:TusA-related sulfurtransferase